MCNKLFVMTVPAAQEEDIFTIRGYVLECLRLGVLIIGTGVSWEVVDIPELGGVMVKADPEPTIAAEVDEGLEDALSSWETGTPKKFMGPRAAEKRSIHTRLVTYRAAHGLGSFAPLIAAGGGQLSESDIYMAISCEPLDMETWRRIGKALDAVEG